MAARWSLITDCKGKHARMDPVILYNYTGDGSTAHTVRSLSRHLRATLAVLGDPGNGKRKNPVGPCGVCSEWVRKLYGC
jgi:hypothetical protein